MTSSYKLIEEGRKDELWAKHCGYLNLSRAEFMEIQKRLMLEQIKLLGASKVGKYLLKGKIPSSIEEFRKTTPLTTYPDYSEFLMEKNEDGLPAKPFVWARTSGLTSNQGPKWVPYTKNMYDRLSDPVIGAMLMSSCSQPGDVKLERNDKLLLATAPPPYTSGYISRSTRDHLDVKFLPPLEEAEKMSYGERVALGFKCGMKEGLDYFMGLSVVLARMGEQFEQQSNTTKPSKELLNPFILWRLFKAIVVSKINNRKMLPKDIWKLKGIMTGGTDSEIYREKIEYYWGKKPLEGYASTEGGHMAVQAWNYKGMIFFPDCAFLEFIPLSEHQKNKTDPNHQPKTFLYDELDIGIYELVFSNYQGGVFVRYRIGDFFEVISLDDKEIGCNLPQVKFYSRAKDVIDLGNIVRLTERDIWKAITATSIQYQDWIARKEVVSKEPILHIYIELKPNSSFSREDFKEKFDQELCLLVPDYSGIKEILGKDPLKVSYLPQEAFSKYMKAKIQAGADLAHLKPPHMQPSDEILMQLQTA